MIASSMGRVRRGCGILAAWVCLAGCSPSLAVLVREGKYRAAFSEASRRGEQGELVRLLGDAGVLSLRASANASFLRDGLSPILLDLRLERRLRGGVRPVDFYFVALRHGGLLWTSSRRPEDAHADARARRVVQLYGRKGALWPPAPPPADPSSGQLLGPPREHSTSCFTAARESESASCEVELALLPRGPSLGRNALVVEFELFGPDGHGELDWAVAEIPLPEEDDPVVALRASFSRGAVPFGPMRPVGPAPPPWADDALD